MQIIRLKIKHIKPIIVESVNNTAGVLLILSSASLFSRYMVWESIPQKAAAALAGIATNKVVFIIIVLLFMLFLGMFLDTAAALVILPPLLLPVAMGLGINIVHFGIILCLMDTIGGITPPFGVMLFAVMGVTKVSVREYLKEGWPLILAVFAVILLVSDHFQFKKNLQFLGRLSRLRIFRNLHGSSCVMLVSCSASSTF